MEDFNQVKVKIPVRQEPKGSRSLSLGCTGHLSVPGPPREKSHSVGADAREEEGGHTPGTSGMWEYGFKATVLHLGNLSMRPFFSGRHMFSCLGSKKSCASQNNRWLPSCTDLVSFFALMLGSTELQSQLMRSKCGSLVEGLMVFLVMVYNFILALFS